MLLLLIVGGTADDVRSGLTHGYSPISPSYAPAYEAAMNWGE